MRKRYLLMLLPVLVLAVASTSYGWQGRMGGMGDPYGLVADESDYLIHPAKIAKGEGVRFYGDYRFTYWGVLDRDVDFSTSTSAASLDMSGYELRHDALVGAAFPLGPGRMGIFFNYKGQRDDIGGDWESSTAVEPMSKLDDFALRLLYGLPVGGLKLGGEVGFAYRQEEHELFYYATDLSGGVVNLPDLTLVLLTPPFVYYDSPYWEIPMKLGVEGAVGPVDVELSLRGGIIVSGDNTWSPEVQSPVGVVVGGGDYGGDTTGWRIGGDLWLRYPLADDLVLPVLVRVDYQEKTRDADGSPAPTVFFDYENNETSLHLVAGGGLDMELSKNTRIAAGLYYSFLHDTADLTIESFDVTGVPLLMEGFGHKDYPDFTEHRATVRFAGEHAFSPMFTLRMGLEGFYGWAMEDVLFLYYGAVPGFIGTIDHSLGGSHWGIGASLGGTVKVKPITLEPFFNVGYQSLTLSGDGEILTDGVLTDAYDRDDARNAWYIGGGLSVLFDLP